MGCGWFEGGRRVVKALLCDNGEVDAKHVNGGVESCIHQPTKAHRKLRLGTSA